MFLALDSWSDSNPTSTSTLTLTLTPTPPGGDSVPKGGTEGRMFPALDSSSDSNPDFYLNSNPNPNSKL